MCMKIICIRYIAFTQRGREKRTTNNMVLILESRCKGSSAPSFTSPVVDEESRRPGHWNFVFPSMFWHTVYWKGIQPIKIVPLIPNGSVLEQVEEETKGNCLTKVHLENGFLRLFPGQNKRQCWCVLNEQLWETLLLLLSTNVIRVPQSLITLWALSKNVRTTVLQR